jgi:hypothetical protein
MLLGGGCFVRPGHSPLYGAAVLARQGYSCFPFFGFETMIHMVFV